MELLRSQLQSGINTIRTFKEVQDYIFQFALLNRVSSLLDKPLRNPELAKKYQKDLLKEVWNTINWDRKNIALGLYPNTVIKNRSLLEKTTGLIKILMDYPSVVKRRKNNKTIIKSEVAKDFPEYFTRAFHFQTDGYLSDKSAELYEQQVDILFTGLADIMRRCFFPYIVKQYSRDKELNILEMACGTGRGSELLQEVFPFANYTLNDLSPNYLEFAKKKFTNARNFRFIQGEAHELTSLKSDSFDLSFHIFLFHEIPHKTRLEVLKEQIRLTKKEGYIVVCDSLQIEDRPEWKEVLEDFPRRYHEPFYRNYIDDDLELMASDLGLKLVHREKVLLTKCLIFQK